MKKRYWASFPWLDKVICFLWDNFTIQTLSSINSIYELPILFSLSMKYINKRLILLNETCSLGNEDSCSCIKYEVFSLKLKKWINQIFNCLKLTQSWLPNPTREQTKEIKATNKPNAEWSVFILQCWWLLGICLLNYLITGLSMCASVLCTFLWSSIFNLLSVHNSEIQRKSNNHEVEVFVS